jgi:hypothetical protein
LANINSDGQQFHQYHQNEQASINSDGHQFHQYDQNDQASLNSDGPCVKISVTYFPQVGKVENCLDDWEQA